MYSRNTSTLLLLIHLAAIAAAVQAQQIPLYRVACGASSNQTDSQNRNWEGDGAYLNLGQSRDLNASASAGNPNLPDSVPFSTSRIFTASASYSFPVTPGRYWLRLFFYPIASSSFPPQNAIFSVSANSFSLISNLSISNAMAAENLAYIFKEYSINVSSSFFTITFTPSTAANSSNYAMANGIELAAMPDNLFSDSLPLVGFSTPVPIATPWIAFETLYRLNVGGQNVKEGQDVQGRLWTTDLKYILGAAAGVGSSVEDATIAYGNLPNYTAPVKVYNSARFMSNDNGVNLQSNLSWIFSVDPNFTYYVRLHFCELQYNKLNMRVFNIYINQQMAYENYDVFAAADGEFVATIEDFGVQQSSSDSNNNSSISVQLHPSSNTNSSYYNAILNGLEIFKLNDSAGNLQGPLPPPAPATEASSSPASSSSSSSRSKMVAMVGGIVGAIAAVAALMVLAICLKRRRGEAKSEAATGQSISWLPIPSHPGTSESMGSKLSSGCSRKSGSYVSSVPSNNCRYFTIAEMREITKDFDEANVIGVGGFGKVYKGVLEDGMQVAVKRGNPTSEQGAHEFQTEIELLSKLRHRHLVSLIGFCEDQSEMILVYDFMANGPLRGHLYGTPLPPLSWKQRLEICIGAARGLHYLHTGSSSGIIHRDVKTTNILLDENLVAKVSDFGLSKTSPSLHHTHVSTAVKGSFGYLDPEYFRRQQLTEKSDVYSFGVVLLEVLLARPAINPALPRDEVNMAEWAMKYQKKGMLEEIIDPYLKGRVSKESLKKYAETAEKCLAESSVERPAMGDILWSLEYSLQLNETWQGKGWDKNSNPKVKEIAVKEVPEEGEVELVAVTADANAAVDDDEDQREKKNSVFSENSNETSASAVFSQLVTTQQGR